MTQQPAANLPPLDPTNPHLQPTPISLRCAPVETPLGRRFCFTFFSTHGEFTGVVTKEEAEMFMGAWNQGVRQMASTLILPNNIQINPSANGQS